MQLRVADRLVLLNSIPATGDITTLKIVRKLREQLSFTEKEHSELKFKEEASHVFWNTEADTPKDINIGPKAAQIVSDALQLLNKQKKLTEDHLPVWEMFCSENEEE